MQNRIVAHVGDTQEMSIVSDDYSFKCSRAISGTTAGEEMTTIVLPKILNLKTDRFWTITASAPENPVKRSCYAGSVPLPFIEKLFKLQ